MEVKCTATKQPEHIAFATNMANDIIENNTLENQNAMVNHIIYVIKEKRINAIDNLKIDTTNLQRAIDEMPKI